MQIRVGYELVFDCPQPVPMMLAVNVHSTRRSDLLVPDDLTTDPLVPVSTYLDHFDNVCSRIVAPAGPHLVLLCEIRASPIRWLPGRSRIQSNSFPSKPSFSCWAAAIARPIGCRQWRGVCARIRLSGRLGSMRSATSSTSTSRSAISTRGPPRPHGRRTRRRLGCAATSPTWR